MRGYYSEKQAPLTGVVVYTTPEGGVVQCTEAVDGDRPPSWNDAVCVGEVVRFVRRVSEPKNIMQAFR